VITFVNEAQTLGPVPSLSVHASHFKCQAQRTCSNHRHSPSLNKKVHMRLFTVQQWEGAVGGGGGGGGGGGCDRQE